MSKREYFLRYSLIIKRLQKSRATFEEINNYLVTESDVIDFDLSISKRTFQRDLNEIRDIFNVDIQYDTSNKVYSINQIDKSEVTDRMLEAFEIFNALNVSADLSHFVLLERRKPQGVHHFHGLLHCIKNSLIIKFSYHKYEDDIVVKREVEPYALKEFKGRWYLIAKDIHDEFMKTYGLDRILELDITKKKFERSNNFDAQQLFNSYFGIINSPEGKVEEIILSFDSFQGKYVKSFPLHSSQQIILDNDDETQIKLSLHITYDFIMELLSYGERVKVISPITLRDSLLERYSAASRQYS
ncbi:MAG: WYL domain-containing protein [Bacteroidetes bacterium]|nr:WYL domain-containing protein [Bacteroidota bacterium]MBS1540120.1 WYL domain-containing protein [Bacteroidota bacterium]